MSLPNYALTTLAKVKARRDIPSGNTANDTLLERLIVQATDIIERECGGRRFKASDYTQEIYSKGKGEEMVFLRNWPITVMTSAQYRPGTPDVPAWTDLLGSEYEVEDGLGYENDGIVRVYGGVSGVNALRFSYTAGYLINFAAEDTPTSHNLPWELTDLCERLTLALFNKRTDDGKSQISSQEVSITWAQLLTDPLDKRIIQRHQRMRFA